MSHPLEPDPLRRKRSAIVIVDDHPMVRERLAEAFQGEADLEVCGEAESRAQALEVIGATRPDLAIVDLSLKNSHGLDLIRDLRQLHPGLLMLVVSMHDESLHAERVLHAGANGYITKQEATRNILLAARSVLAGQIFLGEKTRARIAARLVGRSDRGLPGLSTLTDREFRVFELIAHGQTMRQIADELMIDAKTVETYRARIKEKLGLKDATEVLQHAIRAIHGHRD